MNIFWIEKTLAGCASSLCDKHVVKMSLEYVQMLCNVHHVYASAVPKSSLYKPTHTSHPCSKWVLECSENYNLLYRLWCLTCDEYTKRYGRVHKCDATFRSLLSAPPYGLLSAGKPTLPPVVGNGTWNPTNWEHLVYGYRAYYKSKALDVEMTWRGGRAPAWYSEEL